MNLEFLYNQWESLDLLKAICALIAGMILGFERELKDKAAGLRTITLICLGCTLFTILSYKIGAGSSEDATRIASYVVSGIGFLGAGVIFKDAFSISGLTTASIIWLAAAIGMSIGFGQFSIALTFLLCGLFMIHFGGYINKKFLSSLIIKNVEVVIDKQHFKFRNDIFSSLEKSCKKIELRRIEDDGEVVKLFYECKVYTNSLCNMEEYLNTESRILKYVL